MPSHLLSTSEQKKALWKKETSQTTPVYSDQGWNPGKLFKATIPFPPHLHPQSCWQTMISVARKFPFLNIQNKSYYNNSYLFAYLLHQPEIASHIISLCTCNDFHPCVYNLPISAVIIIINPDDLFFFPFYWRHFLFQNFQASLIKIILRFHLPQCQR